MIMPSSSPQEQLYILVITLLIFSSCRIILMQPGTRTNEEQTENKTNDNNVMMLY